MVTIRVTQQIFFLAWSSGRGFEWQHACMHACMQEQQDGPRRSMCVSLRPFMFWQHLWLAGRKNSGLCQKKNRWFSLSKIIVPFSISKMTFARHFFSPFGEIDSCSISLSYECHWSTSMQQTEDRFCERPNPLETCVLVVFSWRWIVPCMFTALLAF